LATKNEGIRLELRELTGTVGARKSRSSGRIPGVIYGHGQTPLAIAVEAKAVGTLLHGRRQSIIDVTLDGKKDTAIVREVQLDPVTRRVLSIDFQRVSRTDVITANVPIVTVGTPAGVREQGGLMDLVTHEIVVRGPADKIPEAIRIDVSALTIGQNIAASELQLGEGMRLQTPPDTTIVSISAPRVEEEAAPAAAPEGAEAAAPAEGGAPSEATPAQ
jgi:large subunit ribosomal protein L25